MVTGATATIVPSGTRWSCRCGRWHTTIWCSQPTRSACPECGDRVCWVPVPAAGEA